VVRSSQEGSLVSYLEGWGNFRHPAEGVGREREIRYSRGVSASRESIAVVSDVHGNVPALEAVLDDLAGRGVDEVLVGGDLVGRGPQGSRVVKRIRGLGFPAIKGNHEDYLLDFRHGRVPEEWLEGEEWAASRFMAAELDPDDAAYVAALPFSLTRPGLFLVHGSPRSNREGIGPWTDTDELEELLDGLPEELLVCAHTHRPLERAAAGRRAVNVGSVGLPFNRDRRAQYAIFHRRRGAAEGFEVEFRQVAYDLEEIFEIYRSSGFLERGGITARLLYLELEHATPMLVPFLEWVRARGVRASETELEAFLGEFRPDEPLRDFFARLRSMARAAGQTS